MPARSSAPASIPTRCGTTLDGAFDAGEALWVQVDAANVDSVYGGVVETHEIVGGTYNNILGPVNVTSITRFSGPTIGGAVVPRGGLPERP